MELELRGITKRFGPLVANDGISLSVAPGQVHALLGENGAGKTTLMNVLFGLTRPDQGEIHIDGKAASFRSPKDAIAAGIGMVHQHFMLVPVFTVAENVALGHEETKTLGWLDRRRMRTKVRELSEQYGLRVDPDALTEDLPVGVQQRVEILKALVRGAEILVLDEPTAVLTPAEADQLFDMLRVLKSQRKTIVFITHKLREIMALTDRVSVMRRGEMVATYNTSDTSPPELADSMVGRKVILKIDKGPAHPGRVVLEARDLVVRDDRGVARVDGVSFTLREGEILGIAGVAGNGQSELLEALAGIRASSGGEILIDGRPLALAQRNPHDERLIGIGHVPEDRHRAGLVMPFEACESAMLGFQYERTYGRGLLYDRKAIIADADRKMEAFDVRPRAPLLKTANFSGGNQQKLVLAREIERNPKILLVGQPTRGVDIGAIEFIHKRIVAQRDAGKAVLLVSVELDEIFALSDRIIVLCGGRVTGERKPDETNARDLGLLMAGVSEHAA